MPRQIKITELLNPKNFGKHKEELNTYFQKGGTWKELLDYSPSLMQSYYKKAYDLYQKADYKNAAAAFSYLTMLNPYEYTYWMGLGIAKQSDRLYEEAIVSYTAAEAMDPENPLPHLHLAQCFYAMNLREQAIDHLKKTLEVAGEKEAYKEVKHKAEVILKHLPK